jgi:parvulin-like peptidyl-prolyl isomerase
MNTIRCTLHAIRYTLHPILYFLILSVCFFVAVIAHPVIAETSKTVATVNGVAITEAEVDEMLEQIIPALTYHREITPEKKVRFRKDAIERLIDLELLYQEAVRLGLEVSDPDVQKGFDDQKARYKLKSEFSAALKRKGLTEAEYKKRIQKMMLVDRIFNMKVDDPSKVSDSEMRDYYEENKARFVEPEKVKLSEIFIYIPSDADDDIKAEKMKKAGEVFNKVRAGGDFCELASKYSEDDWRVKCGDIGFFHKDRLDETLEKEVWGMKDGEIKMITLEKGIMIVKLYERKSGHQISFDEIKDRLEKELIDKKRERIGEEYMNGLKAKARIEIH